MAFCKNVRSKIKSIIRKFTGYIEDHVNVALEVTTRIKKMLSSPIAGIVTAIIPGQLDDKIRAKLIEGLSYGIEALGIVQNCKDKTDVEEKLRCFIAELNKLHPDLQDAILHKLSSILARFLDDGKEADHIYDLFTQAKYSVEK